MKGVKELAPVSGVRVSSGPRDLVWREPSRPHFPRVRISLVRMSADPYASALWNVGIQQRLRMSKDEQIRVFDLPRTMRTAAVGLALTVGLPLVARAQTDYYNTDRNRPIRIEDAYPTERYSFDAHLAPFRLERSKGGVYSWSVDPEVAYGVLPRTQLEVGLPLAYTDLGASRRRVGVAGLDVSVLYNLNAETSAIPALA